MTDRTGRAIAGRVTSIGGDDWDIATITTTEDLPPALNLADSSKLSEGQSLTVLGYPRGRYSVSSGILNAFESFDGATNREIARTDAAVDRGNSGGPALTAAGEVAGSVSSVDVSGITRPGRLLTGTAYRAAMTLPKIPAADWCQSAPPFAVSRLTAVRQGRKLVKTASYQVQLPLGLLTDRGSDDDGVPYWDAQDREMTTSIFSLDPTTTPDELPDYLLGFYQGPGIGAVNPIVRPRSVDVAVAMRNGTVQRVAYRFGTKTRAFALIIRYTPGPGMQALVDRIVASFAVR